MADFGIRPSADFLAWFRKLRQDNDWSYYEMARLSGGNTGHSTFMRIDQGKTDLITPDTVDSLCTITGLTEMDLLHINRGEHDDGRAAPSYIDVSWAALRRWIEHDPQRIVQLNRFLEAMGYEGELFAKVEDKPLVAEEKARYDAKQEVMGMMDAMRVEQERLIRLLEKHGIREE